MQRQRGKPLDLFYPEHRGEADREEIHTEHQYTFLTLYIACCGACRICLALIFYCYKHWRHVESVELFMATSILPCMGLWPPCPQGHHQSCLLQCHLVGVFFLKK